MPWLSISASELQCIKREQSQTKDVTLKSKHSIGGRARFTPMKAAWWHFED